MANKLLKSLNFGGEDTFTVAHEWKHLGESVGEILPLTTITSNVVEISSEIIEGNSYVVNWNGIDYECIAVFDESEGVVIIGNLALVMDTGDTGEPFCSMYVVEEGKHYLSIMPLDGSTSVTISIKGEVIKPIDTKYLPLDIFVVNVSENGVTKDKAHAEILEAFSNFKTVILVYVGMTFGLTMIDEEGNLIFSKLIVVNGILTNTGFTIKTDETVTMIEDVYTLTPMG